MAITRYLVAAMVGLSALAAEAAQLPYRLDKVAETGAGFTGLDFPAMNDLGVVSFGAFDPAAGRRIFYGNQFLTVPVATPANSVVTGPRSGINNAGQVTYTARPLVSPFPGERADGVYRTEPTGTITVIAEPGNLSSINGGPVINNGGQVAWTLFDTVASRLYVGDGTQQARSPLSSSGNVFDPHLSNAGRTTAIATSIIGGALYLDDQPIVTFFSGPPSTTFTDPDFGTTGNFSVNASDVTTADRVVFAARWTDNGSNQTRGVYLWDNGTISKLLGGSDLNARPSINDNGTVAALLTSGTDTRLSIVRPGGEDRLIGVGDPLFGSTVTSLDWVAEGFNNLDQFTFRATLADGRDVIVLAQIPEPGSALLLVVGAGMILRRRSRALSKT